MKKDIDAKCYELTLTPNYVSDWTFNDALRELIQNGTDQEVLDKENKFQIIYNGKEKTLRLVNQKSVLKINTLLLGRSSKANNEDTVGQFGEGYKIAALVLNRLGKTFTIYNNEKGGKSGSPDLKTLKNGWKRSSHFMCTSMIQITLVYVSKLEMLHTRNSIIYTRCGFIWRTAIIAKPTQGTAKLSWMKNMPEKYMSMDCSWIATVI